jgi:hypothetical protein
MKESFTEGITYPTMGCQVSARGQGLALRGVFVLIMVPLGIFVLWKRKRRRKK